MAVDAQQVANQIPTAIQGLRQELITIIETQQQQMKNALDVEFNAIRKEAQSKQPLSRPLSSSPTRT